MRTRAWNPRHNGGSRHTKHLRFMSRLAAVTAAALILTYSLTGEPLIGTVQAASSNLVANASVEDGTSVPTCFSRSGWGTEGQWSFVEGRQGGRAVSLTVAGHESGDRKLLQSETLDCAPSVVPGATYDAGVWYRSTAPVSFTLFRHTEAGWSYWGDLGSVPASDGWTKADMRTPSVPEGTDQVSFGLSLSTDGTLITDDYTLSKTAQPEETSELIVNGSLNQDGVGGAPACFQEARWGNHTTTSGLTADVPEGSPEGTRSYEFTVTGRTSGDAKLIQSEAAGCAPSVQTGERYELTVDYTSTTASISVTAFSHTTAGWQYWTELKSLPATAKWSTATMATPDIPEGVDRISFGVSIFGDGTVKTTNYGLARLVPPEAPEPGNPALVGSWDVLTTELPIRAIHSTLLHDGRLLLIAGSGNDGKQFAAGTFKAVVWDPKSNGFQDVPVPYDMFCAGHVTLPDGKVLLAGGTLAFPEQDSGPNTFKGSDKSYYFDPDDNTFHPVSDMAGAHWYPSLTKLGNGDVWAAGGLNEVAEGTVLTEMFDYSEMRWLPQNQVPQTWSFWGTYPHMFLLEDGKMFYTGGHTFGNGLPGTGASIYSWETAQIWDVPGLREKDMRDQAGSVFIGPVQDQRLMIVGGGNTDLNAPATNLVDIIDMSALQPAYVKGPDLPGPGKGYVNLVNLFDRSVLASNGAQLNRANDVLTAAIYDPAANSWASVDPDPIGRNYHSSAILLPDGRVAVLGSNPMDNSFELRISVYSPPYLFQGDRPEILKAPDRTGYGQAFSLDVKGDVSSASLMAPMSSTHQTDTNARLIDLPVAGTGENLMAQMPTNRNIVPPGPYMLTVLDVHGVPSIAKWVWVS